jgi:hypothetical protein
MRLNALMPHGLSTALMLAKHIAQLVVKVTPWNGIQHLAIRSADV